MKKVDDEGHQIRLSDVEGSGSLLAGKLGNRREKRVALSVIATLLLVGGYSLLQSRAIHMSRSYESLGNQSVSPPRINRSRRVKQGRRRSMRRKMAVQVDRLAI
jgi:hypothetical protein